MADDDRSRRDARDDSTADRPTPPRRAPDGPEGGDDASRRGGAPAGADIPRGTDEHADRGAEGDADGPLGGERREPGR